MTSFIEFLNSNSGAIQAVATVLLVLITIYYAWQTRKNVDAIKASDETHTRPRVCVYLKQRDNWISFVDLVIGNYGQGIAMEVNFTVSDNLSLLRADEKLKEIRILKSGIPTLAPKEVIHIPLVSLIGRVDELHKKELSITVKYKNHSGTYEYSEVYTLDFKALVEHQLGEPPVHQIAKSIKNIEGFLKKIEKTFRNYRR